MSDTTINGIPYSRKELSRRRTSSYIVQEANRIMAASNDISRHEAFLIAWGKLKCRIKVNRSKIAGVSFENRQQMLRMLKDLQKENVRLCIFQDRYNGYDTHALGIMAIVNHELTTMLGYVPRETARMFWEAHAEGKRVLTWYEAVVGQNSPNGTLGCRFNFVIQ